MFRFKLLPFSTFTVRGLLGLTVMTATLFGTWQVARTGSALPYVVSCQLGAVVAYWALRFGFKVHVVVATLGTAVGGGVGLVVAWLILTNWWLELWPFSSDVWKMTLVAVLEVGAQGALFGIVTGLVLALIDCTFRERRARAVQKL